MAGITGVELTDTAKYSIYAAGAVTYGQFDQGGFALKIGDTNYLFYPSGSFLSNYIYSFPLSSVPIDQLRIIALAGDVPDYFGRLQESDSFWQSVLAGLKESIPQVIDYATIALVLVAGYFVLQLIRDRR
jgi:hypothetical protein